MKGRTGSEQRPSSVGLDDAEPLRADGRARDLARTLLPRTSKRWQHVETASIAAAEAAQVLDADDGGVLVSAAWLHDVGYHHPAPPTGFHPLDGAELVTAAGWSSRVAALVAHHSEARFMAAARGLDAALDAWPRECGPVTDGLTYADMTSAPGGGRIGIRERLIDVRWRHAREAPERATARRLREPYLVMAAARVDLALQQRGHQAYPALPLCHGDLHADAVEALATEHPLRAAVDLWAAVHASASMADLARRADASRVVLEGAHRLLSASPPLTGTTSR